MHASITPLAAPAPVSHAPDTAAASNPSQDSFQTTLAREMKAGQGPDSGSDSAHRSHSSPAHSSPVTDSAHGQAKPDSDARADGPAAQANLHAHAAHARKLAAERARLSASVEPVSQLSAVAQALAAARTSRGHPDEAAPDALSQSAAVLTDTTGATADADLATDRATDAAAGDARDTAWPAVVDPALRDVASSDLATDFAPLALPPAAADASATWSAAPGDAARAVLGSIDDAHKAIAAGQAATASGTQREAAAHPASDLPGIARQTLDPASRTGSPRGAYDPRDTAISRQPDFAATDPRAGQGSSRAETAREIPGLAQTFENPVENPGLLPLAASGVAAFAGSVVANTIATPAMQGRIDTPFNTPAWGQSLSQQISWMVSGAHQSAELHLHPADLGPVQVVLSVENQHAELVFVAREPAVREAIEAALPRLREMFAESGIQLGQASVSAEQQARDPAREAGRGHTGSTHTDAADVAPVPAARAVQRGLVDTFA